MSRKIGGARLIALRISLIYAVLAAAWIYASDKLLASLFISPERLTALQTYKGWLFVAISALLLYGLVAYSLRIALLGNGTDSKDRPSVQPDAVLSYPAFWVGGLVPLAIFLLLSCAIGAVGYLGYDHQKASLEQDKRSGLQAVAAAKVTEIERWLSEQQRDAELAAGDPLAALAIQRWLGGAADSAERQRLLAWLRLLKDKGDYADVLLLDGNARVSLAAVSDQPLHAKRQALALQAMRSGRVMLSDLHWRQEITGGVIEMGLIAPLAAGANSEGQGLPGALFFRIYPRQFLFPALRSWPMPSASAEVLLVRRDGEQVLFLNELRFREHTALNLRLPLDDEKLPAAMSARGRVGVFQGIDYRGVPVLAAIQPVANTPWYLVAKIDTEEIYAPLRIFSLLVAAVVGLMIVVAGIGNGLWWRQQHARFVAEGRRREHERDTLVRHFDYLSRFANDIILLVDENHRIIEANDRACQSYGYGREALLGMPASELWAPTARADFQRGHETLVGDDQTLYQSWQRHRDGTVFPVEVSARKIDIDGKCCYQFIIRDITERHRAEEQLRLRNTALEAAANGIIITDRDGVILWVNPAFTTMTGYTAADALGQTPRFLKSGRQEQGFYERMWETLVQGRVWRGELINRCKNGSLYTEDMTITPLSVRGEKITHYIAIKQDITERKQAMETLRDSEERFRAIFEQAAVGIATLAPQGELLRVNEKFCQILGYTEEELLSRTLQDIIHAMDLKTDSDLSDFARKMLVGEHAAYSKEKRLMHKDGSAVWINLTLSPVLGNDTSARYFMAVIEDISQRKVIEDNLRQALKMEAIGQLTGGIAHDFNNLLAVILGSQELLDEELIGRPDLQNLVQQSMEAVSRGSSLTHRLLSFARRQPLQPVSVDLNRLIAGMTELLKRTLGETFQVNVTLADDLPCTIIDAGQFENALLNLVLNARDAMPSGGTLAIETANRELDADYAALYPDVNAGWYVMLAVSDTGTGMAPEVLNRAFDPFFTTKEVGKGSGLGLSMVYGLVRQSNGHIKLYSEPGKGTVVKIYLPQGQLDDSRGAIAEDIARSSLPRGKGETILVVEDEPRVRALAASMLIHLEYIPLIAEDAKTALELLQKAPRVTLLFTDVALPGSMSGVDLASVARRDYPGLKVLFTSGYAKAFLIERFDLREDAEVLDKPYRRADLAYKLRAMLDDGSTLRWPWR